MGPIGEKEESSRTNFTFQMMKNYINIQTITVQAGEYYGNQGEFETEVLSFKPTIVSVTHMGQKS